MQQRFDIGDAVKYRPAWYMLTGVNDQVSA